MDVVPSRLYFPKYIISKIEILHPTLGMKNG